MEVEETKLNKGIYFFGLVSTVLTGPIGWILLVNHIYHEHFRDGGVPDEERNSLSYTHNKLIWGYGLIEILVFVIVIIYGLISAIFLGI